jgi:hypothetical protein
MTGNAGQLGRCSSELVQATGYTILRQEPNKFLANMERIGFTSSDHRYKIVKGKLAPVTF